MAQMKTSSLSTWTADSRSLACQALRPSILPQLGTLRIPRLSDAGAGMPHRSLILFDKALRKSVTWLLCPPVLCVMLLTLSTC